MSFSNSGPQAATTVTQQLVRRKAWAELNETLIVRVITEMFQRLGLVITKRKLGQAIPVVGVVIGAGLNASYPQSVGRDVDITYRMRFLAEKRALDSSDLAPLPTADATGAAGDYIDIQEIIDVELQKKPGPRPSTRSPDPVRAHFRPKANGRTLPSGGNLARCVAR